VTLTGITKIDGGPAGPNETFDFSNATLTGINYWWTVWPPRNWKPRRGRVPT
jgi:hypothetical protein